MAGGADAVRAGGAIGDGALAAHLAHLATTPGVSAVVVNGHAGEVTSLPPADNQQGEEVAAATHLMKVVG